MSRRSAERGSRAESATVLQVRAQRADGFPVTGSSTSADQDSGA